MLFELIEKCEILAMLKMQTHTFRYSRLGIVTQLLSVAVLLSLSVSLVWLGSDSRSWSLYIIGAIFFIIVSIVGLISVLRFKLIVDEDSVTKRTLFSQTMRYDAITRISVLSTNISLMSGWKSMTVTRETADRDKILEIIAMKISNNKNIKIDGDQELIERYFGRKRVGKT